MPKGIPKSRNNQCRAKSKRSGKRCEHQAMAGKQVCYVHGGKSPGAPKGEKRALVTGQYEKIFPGCLSADEQAHMESMDTVPVQLIEEELRLTRIRELRILERIIKARKEEELAGKPTGEQTESGQNIRHAPMLPTSSTITTGGMGGTQRTVNSEAHAAYILRLENALTSVQAQLGKLIDQKTRLLAELQLTQDADGERYTGIPWEMISSSFLGFIQAVRMHKYTHYWAKGGRGSTKSSSISLAIVDGIINNPDTHAVVMREVFNTIKDSAYAQIQWAIEELGQSHNFQFKKSPLEIIYKPTGQKILFRGLDAPQKLKSIKIPFGYIAWVWYEEASEVRQGMDTIRNVNQSLLRGGDKFWVFYSYNPPKSNNNWINMAAVEQIGRDDTLVHTSNYLTVPPEWLGPQFILEAESLKASNERAYQHEYLGEIVGTGGAVFDNLIAKTITNDDIAGLQIIRHGIDFGFAVDPFAWVECGYNKKYSELYIFDEFCQTKIHDDYAAKIIQQRNVANEPHFCDSSDPKAIANLQREKINARACKKFPGSRDHGYKFLQRWEKIIIDPKRCPNAAREFAACEYEKDKNGNFLSVIPKENDHTIDAVRYALDREIDNARPATSTHVSTR